LPWASIDSRSRVRWRRTRSSTSRPAPASATSPISWVKEGVIDHYLTFIAGSLLAKTHDELRFGEYQFAKQASLHDVLKYPRQQQGGAAQITVAEGLTSEQIVQRLLEADMLAGNIREIPREDRCCRELSLSARHAARPGDPAHAAGPESAFIQEVWDHRAPDLPLRTPEQLVTLASIVEKETGRADERTRVAAVFVNRLKQRMKAAIGPDHHLRTGRRQGHARPADPAQRNRATDALQYLRHRGTAAGPDRQSRGAALEAVANPARTKELYFVADGTGGHSFSESLDQHQRNVSRLRALEQQQRDGATAAVATDPFAAAPAAAAPAPCRPSCYAPHRLRRSPR